MRKMRKQPVGREPVSSRQEKGLEAGDRVFRWVDKKRAIMFDLVAYRGNRGAAGELWDKPVKKDGKERTAICKDGIWFWE